MFQILLSLTAVGLVLYGLAFLAPQNNNSSNPIQPTSTAVSTPYQEPSLIGKAGDVVAEALARAKSLVEQKADPQTGPAAKGNKARTAIRKANIVQPSTKTTAHSAITRQAGDVPEPPLEEVYFGATTASNETAQPIGTPLVTEHTDQHNITEVIKVSRDNGRVFARIERLTREH